MKSFTTILTEARRNPELNVKQFPVEALLKYEKDLDIFISFISNAKEFTETGKSGELSAQVGLNTKSKFNTPNGVYTYPLEEVYLMYSGGKEYKRFNVPFVKEKPKIAILKRKGNKNINDVGRDYKQAMLEKDVRKIIEYASKKLMDVLNIKNEKLMYYMMLSVIEHSMKGAKAENRGAEFWNITRTVSGLIAQARKVKQLTATSKEYDKDNTYNMVYTLKDAEGPTSFNAEVDLTEKDKIKDFLPDKVESVPAEMKTDPYKFIKKESRDFKFDLVIMKDPSPNEKKGAKPAANAWANLLINIGYDSISDRSGYGIIHEAEPVQAVFLSRAGYKVLDIIDNKTYEDKTPHAIEYKKLDSKEKKINYILKDIIRNKYDPMKETRPLYAKGNVAMHTRMTTFYKACKDYNVKLDKDVLEEVIKKEPDAAVGMHHYTDDAKFLNYFYKWAFIKEPMHVRVLMELENSKLDVDSFIFALKEAKEKNTSVRDLGRWVNRWYELKKEVPLKLQLAAVDIWPGMAKYFGDSKELEVFEKILKSDEPSGIKGFFMHNSTKSITDFSKEPKFETKVIDIIVNDYFKDLGPGFFKDLEKETEEVRKNKLDEQLNYIAFTIFRRKLTPKGAIHLNNRVYNFT